jgi:hypothetical protein
MSSVMSYPCGSKVYQLSSVFKVSGGTKVSSPVSQVSSGSKVSHVSFPVSQLSSGSKLSHVSSPVSRVSSGSKVSSGSEVTQVSPPLSQVSTPIYFKGADHILSNFYSCTLIYQGVTFTSSQHLYQYRKAVEHSDFYLAKLILEAQTAKESKSISKHIKTSQQWFYSK